MEQLPLFNCALNRARNQKGYESLMAFRDLLGYQLTQEKTKNQKTKMNKTYLANAFSLQMLENLNCQLTSQEVDISQLPHGATSIIGHTDMANVLSSKLGRYVSVNRESVKLQGGDILYVAQYVGGRLPEGAMELPEGASFKFIRMTFRMD